MDPAYAVNGCGPGWAGRLFPNGPEGRFGPACNGHDIAYRWGGDEAARKQADDALLRAALGSVQYAAPGMRALGVLWAYFYWAMVRLFGRSRFTYRP